MPQNSNRRQLSRQSSLVLCCVLLWLLASRAFAATVKQQPWGNSPAGDPVSLFTVDAGPAQLQVTDYGARIVAIRLPGDDGKTANVVLTQATPAGYTGPLGAVMGATIGRYANRIAGGQIELDGTLFTLAKNNGGNTLHGGPAGFNTKVWHARKLPDGVEMTLLSPDGDMGFPGALAAKVTFRLSRRGEEVSVAIAYEATATRSTVVNFTNHTFFNLSGNPDTPVLPDLTTIESDRYTAASMGLPTGALDLVAGTALDFRTPHALGAAIPDRGYDSTFVLRSPGIHNLAARVDDPASGRTLRVYTTEPGLQLFVSHAAPPVAGAPPPRFPVVQAFCLETQHYPDSPHHPDFPDTTLRPGQTFRSQTTYVFSKTADLN